MKMEEEQSIKSLFNLIINQIEVGREKVIDYKTPKELREEFDFKIGKEGIEMDDLLSSFKLYLDYSADTNDVKFQNQLFQGFNAPAFMGEVITSLSNTSMYTYEVAPVATLMEMELVKKMCEKVGYEGGDGIFTTGGSNSNLMAMYTARNVKEPSIKSKGMSSAVLTGFVSENAHYSFKNAANMIGIGSANLRKIKVDENDKMDLDHLKEEIRKSKANGEVPFFLAATAGTTMRGAYDPIDAMANIAEEENIWLHVDGSFGGSILLSNTHKVLMKGVKRADSVAWNPHKLMNIPLICSMLLIKKNGLLEWNNSDINTDYIYHENETQNYDLGKKSVQCGRKVDSLKLWSAWKYFGDAGYEKKIDTLIENAAYFENQIIANPQFELLASRESFAVCFRFKSDFDDVNKVNTELRENLREKGHLLINYGYIGENVALRFVSVNPELTKDDIDHFIELMEKEGIMQMNSVMN